MTTGDMTNCSFFGAGNISSDTNFTAENCTNVTEEDTGVSIDKGLTLLPIFVVGLIGNICTIIIVGRFRIHKVPDVLVIGLALTDLLTSVIPVSLAMYDYFSPGSFLEEEIACATDATIAQFTRYASALIVTLISVERYLAVCWPLKYRVHATPKRFIWILLVCWFVAFVLSIVPALDPNTVIISHDGFCLFGFLSDYAYSIVAYAGIQSVVVVVCFILVSVRLCKVHRRRKRMKVQENYNRSSSGHDRHAVTFTKPNLTSRISNLGKSIKKAGPVITESLQLGVEAQFVRMLFAVVVLFYISWTVTVVLIIIAKFRGEEQSLEVPLFWGIRLTVVSTAINPFLYGILARQYRMAYWYVIRLTFSKCCDCCDPPLKDVFAAARTPGGELHGDTRSQAVRRRKRLDAARYGTAGKQSNAGSLWSGASSGLPVLTRTTTHTRVSLPDITEVDFDSTMAMEASLADYTTHIASAGELSSTVVISHQARGKNLEVSQNPRSSSLQNVAGDYYIDLEHEQESSTVSTGVNPLSVLTRLHGEGVVVDRGEELATAEQEVSVVRTGKVYSNPVYEIEQARRSGYDTNALMVATSSNDNLTLVSKKVLLSPTRSLNLPPTPPSSDNGFSPTQPLLTPSPHPPPTSYSAFNLRAFNISSRGKKSNKSVGGGNANQSNANASDTLLLKLSTPSKIEQTVIDEGGIEMNCGGAKHSFSGRSVPDQVKEIETSMQTTREEDKRTPVVTTTSAGVGHLKQRFESPSPPTSPCITTPTTLTPSHTTLTPSHTSSTDRRKGSLDNSDSGRESMVLDHDANGQNPSVFEPPTLTMI